MTELVLEEALERENEKIAGALEKIGYEVLRPVSIRCDEDGKCYVALTITMKKEGREE